MQNKSKFLVLLLTVAVFLASSNLVLAAQQELKNDNLITAIEVEGNKKISKEEILEVVETEVGEQISNQKLQNDLQAIFDLGYFFDVQASFESYRNGVKLIFEVVENPDLKSLEFKGNKSIASKKLKEILDLKEDKLLDTNQLNKGLREIEAYYNEQGYVLAQIEDVLMKKDGTLKVKINEGKVAKIKIEGNEKTKDFVIKRKLSLEPGDVFNADQMRQDLRDIYNLGFFKDIKPELNQTSAEKNEVALNIKVEERKTGNVGVGAGYSSSDGWLGHFEIQEKNFRGRAQRLGFRWEVGEENTTYELSFYEPWAFGSDTSVSFSIYDRRDEKTGFYDPTDETDEGIDYEEHEKGGSITLGHPLGYDVQGYLTYEYNKTINEALEGETALPEGQESNTRSLTSSFVRDTRNDVFNPTDGRKDKLSVEYAGQALGGDNDFTKYQLDLRDYTPDFMFEDNSWAFRFKAGLSEGLDEEGLDHERYRIGGPQTLRGFKDDQFVGEEIMLFNAEYRIPFADNFTGVLFTDAGKAWNKDEGFDFDDINKSAGVGVRFKTPMGQLRLDYGWQEEDSRLHFSIGQLF
ncbi:BamA/OMP85 family outer membrane protein [Acetohalobium arabaticum]|uniref:Surface antigen (D15) n=1 Tax=Acetohalobium arabaticum (strain ATCC 49924 / DSM 5501 / Z-7288) TaxID=574087 RepID=D9QTW6_ACEAZ|nr:BamA/TamA family outer membrane protein [Acetohalobium arabaticum]ADL13687.1 surface antigen (D15) [Acetohalobium arabaticum DSM 5501]